MEFNPRKGFKFNTTNTPVECGTIDIEWSGAHPPLMLTITGIFARQFNETVSGSSHGTANLSLPFRANDQYLLTLSDARGFASGGTLGPYTVQNATAGQTCDHPHLGGEYFYFANQTISQCGPYRFWGFDNATQPIAIYAMVPNQSSRVFYPPIADNNSYVWTAGVPGGANVVFSMIDSQGKQGGTTKLLNVISYPNSETACLEHKKVFKLSPGVIAGISICWLVLVMGLVVSWLLFKSYSRRRAGARRVSLNLTNDGPPTILLPSEYKVTPFTLPTEFLQRWSFTLPTSPTSVHLHPLADPDGIGGAGSPALKRGILGQSAASVVPIVHSDIEEGEEYYPVELPPQYSAGRHPIQRLVLPSPTISDIDFSSPSLPNTSTEPLNVYPPSPPPRPKRNTLRRKRR